MFLASSSSDTHHKHHALLSATSFSKPEMLPWPNVYNLCYEAGDTVKTLDLENCDLDPSFLEAWLFGAWGGIFGVDILKLRQAVAGLKLENPIKNHSLRLIRPLISATAKIRFSDGWMFGARASWTRWRVCEPFQFWTSQATGTCSFSMINYDQFIYRTNIDFPCHSCPQSPKTGVAVSTLLTFQCPWSERSALKLQSASNNSFLHSYLPKTSKYFWQSNLFQGLINGPCFWMFPYIFRAPNVYNSGH